jgi:hypothetical protein
VNNPYKRIGGGSLDQELFKKGRQTPETVTPSQPQKDQSSSAPVKSPAQQEIATKQFNPSDGVRPNAPSTVRPNGKRIITRNSFEIYEDQMDSLRKLSFQEKLKGRLGSMSNMVREAIDEYLQKKSSS